MYIRVSHAVALFGPLHRSVFSDGSFSKSIVYKAVVLGVLLYAVKTHGLLSRGNWKFSIIIV